MPSRWTGHVIRMEDNRLPKQVFYSQLEQGTRSHGGQRKRYKDVLKSNLTACNIDPHDLESSGHRGANCVKPRCYSSNLTESTNCRRRDCNAKQAWVRQPAASLASHVAASALRELVSFHTAKHIRDEICRINGSVNHHIVNIKI